MPTTAAKSKYRPVLTSAQILKILELAKTEAPHISPESFSLISTLAPFQAKIENATISPAYTTTPAKPARTSLEALGGAPEGHRAPEYNNGSDSAYLSKEQYWEQCYNKYSSYPASCSLEEIQGAKEYKYLNDLMSPEEMLEFEADNIPNLDGNNSLV